MADEGTFDEERYQPRKTYCFNNCGTVNVNVNSFNAHGVIMENCSNHVRQFACASFLFLSLRFCLYVSL